MKWLVHPLAHKLRIAANRAVTLTCKTITAAMRFLPVVVIAVMVLLFLYWAVMPYSSPLWTGFGPYDEKVSGPRARTLWDWTELLLVPIVLALGAWWLNKSERDTDRELARQRDVTEREIAADRQWQATLEAYFDRMTDLLLHEGLRSSQQKGEVQIIGRTRTLAVMRSLDRTRKGQVIRFLYEAGLLEQDSLAINIEGADLVGIDLKGARLSKVSLNNARLTKADLSYADLVKADFQGAQLVEADLRSANLTGASLIYADLSRADLREAQLDEADLRDANLSGANLEGASLSKADLSSAKLDSVNLRGANLYKANLACADLTKAQLRSFRKTHLRGANLMGATLVNADLAGVELSEANLMGANLIGANLLETNLRRANLTEVALGSMNDLRIVKSLHGAILPDGTEYDGRVVLGKITSSHIVRAIKLLDKREYRLFSDPISKHILTYRGKFYLLNYLIPLAYESEDGLPHDVFDEEETKEYLTALGFTVQNISDTIPKD